MVIARTKWMASRTPRRKVLGGKQWSPEWRKSTMYMCQLSFGWRTRDAMHTNGQQYTRCTDSAVNIKTTTANIIINNNNAYHDQIKPIEIEKSVKDATLHANRWVDTNLYQYSRSASYQVNLVECLFGSFVPVPCFSCSRLLLACV